MNVREMIGALISKGYSVTSYVRPDGGVRITSINGQRFEKSSAQGNQMARLLLSVRMTKSQIKQRRLARKAITKPLTKSQKRILRRANKVRELTNQKKYSLINARKSLKYQSFKELRRALRNANLHKLGFAYKANVEWFLGVLQESDTMYDTQKFLIRYSNTISDDSLTQAHEIFYRWQEGRISMEAADQEAVAVLKAGREDLRTSMKEAAKV
jgi:hypothetical protein